MKNSTPILYFLKDCVKYSSKITFISSFSFILAPEVYAGISNTLDNTTGDIYFHIHKEGEEGGNETTNAGSILENAGATGKGSIAGGIGAQAKGEKSMAVGNNSYAFGENSVAVGNGAQALGDDTVATGQASRAYGKNAIVIGNDAEALGKNSMAAGENARAHGESSISIGRNAIALGAPEDYVANGAGKFVKVRIENDLTDHFAIYTDEIKNEALKSQDFVYIKKSDGINAWVDKADYDKLSYTDKSKNDWYSLKKYKKIEREGKGYFVESNYQLLTDRYDLNAKNMIAIGEGAVARREGSVALGNKASAIGQKSLAQGYIAQASGEQSIAIGNNAKAGLVNTALEFFEDKNTGNYYLIKKPGTNGEYLDYIAQGEIKDDYEVKIKYRDHSGKLKTKWEKYSTAKSQPHNILNYSKRDGDLTVAIGADAFAIEHGAMAIGQKAFAGSAEIDYVKDDNGSIIEINGEYSEVYAAKFKQDRDGNWVLARDNKNNLVLKDPTQIQKIKDKKVIIEARDKDGKVTLASAEKYAKNQRYSSYDVKRTDGKNAVAFGLMSHATNRNAMAMGNYSSALGENAVALGKGSEALGFRSMALGTDSLAGNKNAENIDQRFEANETGIYVREVSKYGQVSYTRLNTQEEREAHKNDKKYSHKGDSTIAMGYKAEATNYASLAFGHRSHSSGLKSMALGNKTDSSGIESGAFGYGAKAKGDYSYAIGTEAFAGWDGKAEDLYLKSSSGIYINKNEKQTGRKADYIFVGDEIPQQYKGYTRYSRRGDMSLAMGYKARANSFGSLALGYSSDATGKKGLAIGNRTEASGQESTAVGYDSHANGYQSIANGFKARATGEKSMVFGNDALAGYLVNDYTRDDKGDYVSYKGKYIKVEGNKFNYHGQELDITDLEGVYRYRKVAIKQSPKNYFNENEIGDFVYLGNKTGAEARTDSANYAQLEDSYQDANGKLVKYDGEAKYMQVEIEGKDGKKAYKYIKNNVDGEFVLVGSEYKHLIKSYRNAKDELVDLQPGQARYFAKSDYNLAIGYNSKAANRAASAFGYNAHALGDHSAALGNMAVSTGEQSIAVGNGAFSAGEYSVVLGNKSFAGFDSVEWIRDDQGEFVEVKNAYYKLSEKQGQLIYTDKNGQEHYFKGAAAGQYRYQAVDVNHLVKNFSENAEGMFGRLDEQGGHNPNDEGQFVALIKEDGKLYYKDVNKEKVEYQGKRYQGNQVGGYTIALGYNSAAVSKGSTAIGYNAHAIGDHSTAFGNKAISTGVHSLAFGTKTLAQGNSSSAMGNYSEAYGDKSLALGDSAYAGGFKEDANGKYALNEGVFEEYDPAKHTSKKYSRVTEGGENTIAIGNRAEAYNENAIAFGTGAKAEGKASFASGNYSFAGFSEVDYYIGDDGQGGYGIVDGNYYLIDKDGKINGQHYTGNRFVRIETEKTSGNHTLALGTYAVASNNSAIAIGDKALAMGEHSTAIGDKAFAGIKSAYEKDANGDYVNYNKKYVKVEALQADLLNQGYDQNAVDGVIGKLSKYTKKSGADTLAIGYQANATDEGATAIGIGSRAGGKLSMAIGKNSVVDGTNATGIGNNSFANGRNASAYGVNAVAIGGDALAVGTMSRVDGENGIAIGNRANVKKDNSIAMGKQSNALGERSIAIGNESLAGDQYKKSLIEGEYVIMPDGAYKHISEIKDSDYVRYNGNDKTFGEVKDSVDKYVKTAAPDSIALGYQAASLDKGAMALGNTAKAKGEDAIAIGLEAKALAENAIAFGKGAEAAMSEAFALGNNAKALQKNTIALGFEAEATKESSLALGNKAKALGQKGISLGNEAKIYTESSVAIGDKSRAGMENKSTLSSEDSEKFSKANRNSTAIGSLADAKGGYATAIGSRTRAFGSYSTAIGEASYTDENAKRSIALGARATVGEDYFETPMIGDTRYEDRDHPFDRYKDDANKKYGEKDIYASIAIGRYAHVTKSDAVAIGQSAEVTGENSMAFGRMAEVHDKEDAVALGSYSAVNRDKYVAGYNPSGKESNLIKEYNDIKRYNELSSKENKTSAEEKELHSLIDKDYIWNDLKTNEAKLKDLVKNGDAFVSTSGTVSVGDKEKGILRQITNLAAGSEDTDAVNVAQLKNLGKIVDKNKIFQDKWNKNQEATNADLGKQIATNKNAQAKINDKQADTNHELGDAIVSNAKVIDSNKAEQAKINDKQADTNHELGDAIVSNAKVIDSNKAEQAKINDKQADTNHELGDAILSNAKVIDSNKAEQAKINDKQADTNHELGDAIVSNAKVIDSNKAEQAKINDKQADTNHELGDAIVSNAKVIDSNKAEQAKINDKQADTNHELGDAIVSNAKVIDSNKAEQAKINDKQVEANHELGNAILSNAKAIDNKEIVYKANGENSQSVKLSDGLDFTNGINTTATVNKNGKVVFDLNKNLKGLESLKFETVYKDKDGNELVQVNNKFYNKDQVVDGKVQEGATEVNEIVSEGTGKISGLAAGENATDAVNKAQLDEAMKNTSLVNDGKLNIAGDNIGSKQADFGKNVGSDTIDDSTKLVQAKAIKKALDKQADTNHELGDAIVSNAKVIDSNKAEQAKINDKQADTNHELGDAIVSNVKVIDSNKAEQAKINDKQADTNHELGDAILSNAKVIDSNKAEQAKINDKQADTNHELGDAILSNAKAIDNKEIVYKANGENSQSVKLSDGLDFTNGINTTATVNKNGKVVFDLNKNLKGLESLKFETVYKDKNGNELIQVNNKFYNKDQVVDGKVQEGATEVNEIVSEGTGKISGLAAGENATDAVNKAQLDEAMKNTSLANDGKLNIAGDNIGDKQADFGKNVGSDTIDYSTKLVQAKAIKKALDKQADTNHELGDAIVSNAKVIDSNKAEQAKINDKQADTNHELGDAIVSNAKVIDSNKAEQAKINDKQADTNHELGDAILSNAKVIDSNKAEQAKINDKQADTNHELGDAIVSNAKVIDSNKAEQAKINDKQADTNHELGDAIVSNAKVIDSNKAEQAKINDKQADTNHELGDAIVSNAKVIDSNKAEQAKINDKQVEANHELGNAILSNAKAIDNKEIVYKANGDNFQSVKLSKGFNFTNGTNTIATVASDGKVIFDLNKNLTQLNSLNFKTENQEVTHPDGSKVTQKVATGTIAGLKDLDDKSTGDMAVNKNYVDQLANKVAGATLKYKAKDNDSPERQLEDKEVSINLASDDLYFEETDNIRIDISKAKGSQEGRIKYALNPVLTGLKSASFGNGTAGSQSIFIDGSQSRIAFEATQDAEGNRQHNGVISGLKEASNDDEAVNLAQLNKAKQALQADINHKADKSYVETELGKKADKTYVDSQISTVNNKINQVDQKVTENAGNIAQNTQAIEDNRQGIQNNAGNIANNSQAIAENKQNIDTVTADVSNKANKDASNIETAQWQQKLGNGEIKENNQGLVTGDTVYKYYQTQQGTAEKQNQAIQENATNIYNLTANVQNRLDGIQKDLHKTREESHAASAAAAAMANLPQAYIPGKSMISAAMGYHKNQQALSIGISTISDNGKWVAKGSISSDSQHNFTSGVGLGYQW